MLKGLFSKKKKEQKDCCNLVIEEVSNKFTEENKEKEVFCDVDKAEEKRC